MRHTYLDYLQDILNATRAARRFVTGLDWDRFAADEKTSYAVVRALQIIGEATKKVPRAWRERHPALPWREMMGLRDKVVHDYFGVDLRVIWQTVQHDLPPLEEAMVALLAELGQDTTQTLK
jgi:uncharacterized protein with HEPN domain